MPVIRRCPSCEKRYRIPDSARGKSARCRACGETLLDEVKPLEDGGDAVPPKSRRAAAPAGDDGEGNHYGVQRDDPVTERKKRKAMAALASRGPSEWHSPSAGTWAIGGGSLVGFCAVIRVIIAIIRVYNLPDRAESAPHIPPARPQVAQVAPPVPPRLPAIYQPPQSEPIKPVQPAMPWIPAAPASPSPERSEKAADTFALTNPMRVRNRAGRDTFYVDYVFTGAGARPFGAFTLLIKTERGTIRTPLTFLRERQGRIDAAPIGTLQFDGDYEMWIEAGGTATVSGTKVSNAVTGR